MEKRENKKKWLWEFSKKVVFWCTILYFVGNIVAMVAMFVKDDLSALGNLLDNLTTVMTTCVFGYMIKSGVENAFKIKLNTDSRLVSATSLKEVMYCSLSAKLSPLISISSGRLENSIK